MNTLRLWTALMAICLLGLLPVKAERYWVDGFEYEFNGHEATVTSCSLSGDIIIPEKVTYNNVTYTLTTIGSLAFYCDHKVTSIRMPNTIKTVNESAFIHANEIKSVYFPGSIEKVHWYAFYNNPKLTTIFCLSTVPPDFGEQGFDGRDSDGRMTLYVPSGTVDAYRSAPYLQHFMNIIPIDVWDFVEDGVYYHIIDESHVTVTFKELGFATYSGTVVIPETVTHDSITYHVTGISASAFAYSDELTSVSIPVTVQSVGNDAFFGCSLQSLIITGAGSWTAGALDMSVNNLFISSGITSIAGMKVEASEIYCSAAIPPTCDDFTFTSYNAALHVPPTSLSAYFTAPYWKYFINITGDADFIWPTAVELDQTHALLEIGETMTIQASVLPAKTSYDNIYWTSSNPNVASVNNGVITALETGECDITASCLTAVATCHIAVVEKKIFISLDMHQASVLPNHMVTITPTLTPISSDITVTSSNPNIAAARLANGIIQVAGISEGTTTITVNTVDGYAIPDSCIVTVYTEMGDVNRDGFINIGDVTSLINYLLSGNDDIISLINSDGNQDGRVSIADVTALINFLLSDSTESSVEVDGDSCPVWNYLIKGKNIPAMRIYHPSAPAGKNWELWHQFHKAFIGEPQFKE